MVKKLVPKNYLNPYTVIRKVSRLLDEKNYNAVRDLFGEVLLHYSDYKTPFKYKQQVDLSQRRLEEIVRMKKQIRDTQHTAKLLGFKLTTRKVK
jgi:hypothetical protein